jgi:hypothetical protein
MTDGDHGNSAMQSELVSLRGIPRGSSLMCS